MMLHNDRETFYNTVLAVSRDLKISPSLVEKDYYVTMILKSLSDDIPGLLFKGGTSLSKCYNIIDRFSEDIDLTLDKDHFTQSKKRSANKEIIKVCDELGLNLANREYVEKNSHSNYNAYNIEYPILFPTNDITPYVKAEIVFLQKAYPYEIQPANSLIGSWLIDNGNIKEAKQLDLEPFDVQVQSLERTFVDKVFAVCDYYMRNEQRRNSRHIYDLSRLLTKVDLNSENLKELVEQVRKDRMPNKMSMSAQDDVSVPNILQKIVDTEFYKQDYEQSTEKILMKPVSYNEAIKTLNQIIESKIFYREREQDIESEKEIIRVLVKYPRKEVKEANIENNLSSLQQIVGGEICDLPILEKEGSIHFIMNNQAELLKLDVNIHSSEFKMDLRGPIIAVGNNEDGSARSLSDEDIECVISYIRQNERGKDAEKEFPERKI